MILGLSLADFTLVHVIVSLIGIAAGAVVLIQMVRARRLGAWNALFLATTILTSVTGFFFPFTAIGAPHVFGVVSLAVMALAIVALYGRHLAGPWRWVYVICALIALYLNTFVAVVQAFGKLSFLRPLAPTGTEPPFAAAQILVLALFLVLGFLAVRRFHPR